MTVINSLTLKGFKSFGYKTEIPFGRGFNIFLGPNGVGKSNVGDALCFVLGKTSAKSMRAEKSANLIFHGGKKYNPSKEAEVTIEFDNSQNKFPIQDKAVKVTRILKHNGVSTYKINNEVRTRQQVVDLLNAAKVDPDGHNIILQGDIISFMEMKPVERRGTIEEISGISAYEDKKQKCLLELNKVEAKLNEAGIILTEREAYLRELRKERDQAKKYKELQDELKDSKATLLHLQIKEKEEKESELKSKIEDTKSKTEKSYKFIVDIKTQINEWKQEINRINEEIEVKGEKEQIILRKEIEDLKIVLAKANARTDMCRSELEKIKTRKKQLLDNIKEIELKIKDLNSRKKICEGEIKNNSEKENEVASKINATKKKYGLDAGISTNFDKIEKEIEEILSKLAIFNEQKQNILRQRDQLQFKISSIEEKLNAIKGIENEAELDIKNSKKLTAGPLVQLSAKKKELKEIAAQLNKLLDESAVIADKLAKARKELFQHNEELARLKARQISIKEKTYSSLAVRKILELKQQLNGIHGTVSELGKVNSKYALALEVAAGQRAHSIVVDTDKTAQDCINYLKEHKLGIATFLPLNKIKPGLSNLSKLNEEEKTDIHGYAINLVNYAPQYRDIFSYVFGSTLVVDNIATARRIGIGRTRMVTIDGDLVETSGAMIGGYRHKETGLGFGSFIEKETDSEVSKIEQKMKELRNIISSAEKKSIQSEVDIRELTNKKANLEGEIIKFERSMGIEGIDIAGISNEKKVLADSIKSLDKELTETGNKITSTNKHLDTLKTKKLELKESMKDPALTSTFEAFEKERQAIREKKLELNAEVKNIQTQINDILNLENERTEKIIKEQDKDLETFSKELLDLEELTKKRNQELKEKELKEKKSYSSFKDLAVKRTKLTEKIQQRETETVREEERKKFHEQKLNSFSIDVAKIIATLEALRKEFEPYKDGKIKRGLTTDQLKLNVVQNEKALTAIGNVNLRALEVYEEIEKEYQAITEKVAKLKSEKEDVMNMMQEIEDKKKAIFMKTYNAITTNFKEIFKDLTTKGEVQCELENPENPFEGGIDIQVKLANNKLLDIKSLSGGEKTLAALSFIFAIQEYSPSPFYLLDEVDAALDKRNSETLSRLILKYSKNAQYVVISHNDVVITEADQIYGISMQDGVSKVVSLRV